MKQMARNALCEVIDPDTPADIVRDTEEWIIELVEMAREEGFEDARETVSDWYQPEPPERDEDR